MFTDHSSLRYFFSKPVLGERIFIWLFLFQELDFEVILNYGRLNARPDNLSRITNGEEPRSLEDKFPDAQILSVQIVDEYIAGIIEFLSIGYSPKEFNIVKRRIW
jgi:hypothetical protein